MAAREHGEERFVPAAGRRALTALYDPVVALSMRERTFRALLREQALRGLPGAGARLLDVGAGTGSFAIALATARPGLEVVALDGDPDVLARARRKRGAERVRWHEGGATALPFPDASFDRVTMSLLLHHLAPAAKAGALAEARRVLRVGGRLHVADFGPASDPAMRLAFGLLQLLDGTAGTRDHADGWLPAYLTAAGFAHLGHGPRVRTAWGTLELLTGTRAAG